MSDISSSSSPTSHRSPPIRRCRKINSRIYRGSGKKCQAKRNSSCGIVGTQPTAVSSSCIPKASLSSPEDLEVDSILQSSSTDDDRNVSSSISSDDEEEDDENDKSTYKLIRNTSIQYVRKKQLSSSEYTTVKDTNYPGVYVAEQITDKESDNSNTVLIRGDTMNLSEEDYSRKNLNRIQSPVKDSLREPSGLSSESSEVSSATPKISNLERLIRTHPVWFQPDLNRDDTTLLLQGKEEGTFIVRKSSQPNTMAISVRLRDNFNCDKKSLSPNRSAQDERNPPLSPEGQRDFVQHYLIEQHQTDISHKGVDNPNNLSNEKLPVNTVSKSRLKMKLECSHNSFDNILSLVYHYLTVR